MAYESLYGETYNYNSLAKFVSPGLQPRGTQWYVNGSITTSGHGRDWAHAKKTIAAAITAAVSGDTIRIAPGTYVENLTIAKSKIALIAATPTGNAKRVAVAPTTGIALDIQTGALSLCAYGIRFVGVGALGYGVQVGADGCRFEDCDFTADTSHGVLLRSRATDDANTGSGSHFQNCLFRECGGKGLQTEADSGTSSFHATNVNVLGCQFYTNTDDDIGDAEQAAATYFYQWLIKGNYFMTKAKTPWLDLDGSVNNGLDLLVAGNYFAGPIDTNGIKMPTTHGRAAGNFGTDTAGVEGGVSAP